MTGLLCCADKFRLYVAVSGEPCKGFPTECNTTGFSCQKITLAAEWPVG